MSFFKKSVGMMVCLATVFSFFSGCSQAQKYTKQTFALDTVINITAYGNGADIAIDSAINEINRLEKLFSVTIDGSDISKINNGNGSYVGVSPETLELISTAQEVAKLTEGAYDPTVFPIVKAWGFTTENNIVPDDSVLKGLLKNVDYTKIEIDGNRIRIPKGFAIDLGGIAKGYISQKVCLLLKESGVTSALISLGGNVQSFNKKPEGEDYKISLCDPKDTEKSVGFFLDSGNAIITSGDYQRFFEKDGKTYHHIIDTKTGYPAESGLSSVTVVAKDGAFADALSTGLFAMGLEKAMNIYRKNPSFEAVFITKDGRIIKTDGLKDKFTPEDKGGDYKYE